MKNEPIKVQIARLKETLRHTYDPIECGNIDIEISKLKAQLKEQETKKPETKMTTVTEAPSVMDRKAKKNVHYNGHAPQKSVNGVFQNETTVVGF